MHRHLILALALTACAERVGPGDVTSCSSTPSPGHDFCQTYAADDSVPGSALTILLRVHDTTIVGNGRYTLEAGSTGTILISGILRQPYLDLLFRYDDGRALHYSGRFGPDNRITGAIFDTAGNPSALSFVPR
jgi:hypothetical protein